MFALAYSCGLFTAGYCFAVGFCKGRHRGQNVVCGSLAFDLMAQ